MQRNLATATRMSTAILVVFGFISLTSCGEPAVELSPKQRQAQFVQNYAKNPIVKPRLAFVTNGIADFWVIAQRGAEQAAIDTGATVTVHMPAEGIADQKRILEDLLAQNINAIAVSAIDPANQLDVLDQVATRTLLVTHDSDAPASARLAYVGLDNYDAGRAAGKLVKAALPNGGEIAIFVGRMEQDNARRRRQGLMDEIFDRSRDENRVEDPNQSLTIGKFTVLNTLTDQFDRAKAKANVEDMISANPNLGCVVGLFTYNPVLALEALRSGGKIGQIKVVGFDEAPETLAGIRDGSVQGTVVQDPYNYGYRSMQLLNAVCLGKPDALPKGGFIDIPAVTVTKDNVDAFEADLKKKLAGNKAAANAGNQTGNQAGNQAGNLAK